jgi:hypothetical protein
VSSQFVGGFETVPFYDNSGAVIGKIKNNTAQTLGCVKLEVDRAGGGDNVPFWSANATEFLAAKTYRITADGAPASGNNYDITLYYTAAEIDKWTTQATRSVNDVKMIKITNHSISEVTPANPLASSVVISNAVTKATYGDADHAFTATFTSFSGFGIGVPNQAVLPVTLLDFKGELQNDKALLSWTTSTEINNKGFYLERSADGRAYSSIAFINGSGNSSSPRSYSHPDFDLRKGLFYYRLKQVDMNGRFTYSKIVVLQITKDGVVKVYPNPVKNAIQILFGQPVTSARVHLYSMAGSKVFSRQIYLNGQSSTTIDISNVSLPKGSYLLQLVYDGKTRQVKMIKE